MAWKPGEVRLVPGGRKQITHCATLAHTLAHTYMHLHTRGSARVERSPNADLLIHCHSEANTGHTRTQLKLCNEAFCIMLMFWIKRGPHSPDMFPAVRRQQKKKEPPPLLSTGGVNRQLQPLAAILCVCVPENNKVSVKMRRKGCLMADLLKTDGKTKMLALCTIACHDSLLRVIA